MRITAQRATSASLSRSARQLEKGARISGLLRAPQSPARARVHTQPAAAMVAQAANGQAPATGKAKAMAPQPEGMEAEAAALSAYMAVPAVSKAWLSAAPHSAGAQLTVGLREPASSAGVPAGANKHCVPCRCSMRSATCQRTR